MSLIVEPLRHRVTAVPPPPRLLVCRFLIGMSMSAGGRAFQNTGGGGRVPGIRKGSIHCNQVSKTRRRLCCKAEGLLLPPPSRPTTPGGPREQEQSATEQHMTTYRRGQHRIRYTTVTQRFYYVSAGKLRVRGT